MITVRFLASAFVVYDPDLVDELMHYALMSADGLKAAVAKAVELSKAQDGKAGGGRQAI